MIKVLLVGANGYIGSLFYQNFFEKIDIFPIDNFLTVRKKLDFVKSFDYRILNKSFLNEFDVCLWLAGHPSVQQSMSDPEGAFNNNTLGLINFSNIFDGTLIYASTGSVYSNSLDNLSNEETPIGQTTNYYDFSKLMADNYFKIYGKNFISLRFGTVVGGSSSFRAELLLNKMSADAKYENKINLANSKSERPVLFIDDLIKSLFLIVKNHEEFRKNIFNLCSINSNMETYAMAVAKYFNSEIILNKDSSTYSFHMDNSKFKKFSNFQFTSDIEKIITNIDEFITKNKS